MDANLQAIFVPDYKNTIQPAPGITQPAPAQIEKTQHRVTVDAGTLERWLGLTVA
jgi:hypothetical protein